MVTNDNVDGALRLKTKLTVSKAAATYARHPGLTHSFSSLITILSGHTVDAHIFSPINIVGYTNEQQLREAYDALDKTLFFWVNENDLRMVIDAFGDGQLGFNLSGSYCHETPADIAALIAGKSE